MHRDNVPAARQLRRRLTPSELLLWARLRDRRFDGLKFRRQHPIGPFVLDFYCDELRVAVEVDGGIHSTLTQIGYDRARQALLEEQGIRVVRVRAEDVEADIEAVLESLRALTPRPPLP